MTNAAEKKKQEQIELEIDYELIFEGKQAEEQLVSLLGCTALKIREEMSQGDEVAIEVRGKVHETRLSTKQRGNRAGGREVTRVVRVIKVDKGKLIRLVPKLVK